MTVNTTPKPKFKQPGEVNIGNLIFVPILIVGIAYIVIAISTRNLGWFLPTNFSSYPRTIEIYHGGEMTTLSPGRADYQRLAEALNEQMNQIEGYYEVGLSPDSLQTSLERSTVVIFKYDSPLRINSRWNLGEPDRIFVPITGSNSGTNRVYTGTENGYGHGGLIVSDLSEFISIVKELGFQ